MILSTGLSGMKGGAAGNRVKGVSGGGNSNGDGGDGGALKRVRDPLPLEQQELGGLMSGGKRSGVRGYVSFS